MHVPAILQLGAGVGPRGDAAVAGLDVERIEAAVKIDVAVAGVSFELAVKGMTFNAAVAGSQPNGSFCTFDTYVAVAGVNIKIAGDRFGFDRAVSSVYAEIGVARHVDFNAQVAMHPAPEKAPGAANASADFDVIAVLTRGDRKVFINRVSVVNDAEFDLLRVAGGYADRAIVRIHMDVSPAADSVR